MKRVLYILLALAVVMLWRDWQQREITYPPGVLVAEAPRQSPVESPEPLRVQGYRLTPRAQLDLRARVLSREDYWLGSEAELSPVDLALGWGAMSDQAVLDRIEVSQSGRWYYTRYERPAPISDGEIIRHSGNMHIVPADAYVESQLKKVRKGDIVRAKGLLVDIDHPSGFRWRTSLTREDTGGGSCEILYLERLQIEGGS